MWSVMLLHLFQPFAREIVLSFTLYKRPQYCKDLISVLLKQHVTFQYLLPALHMHASLYVVFYKQSFLNTVLESSHVEKELVVAA